MLRGLLFSAGILFVYQSGMAQTSPDRMIQQWMFYDDYRDQRQVEIRLQHERVSALAVLADRRQDFARSEELRRSSAVTEELHMTAKRDKELAELNLAFVDAGLSIVEDKRDRSTMLWQWMNGTDLDLADLERLQFQLWEKECNLALVRARRFKVEEDFARYRVRVLRRLHDRQAATASTLADAVTTLAGFENDRRSQEEVYRDCESGPPFAPLGDAGIAKLPLR